MNNQYKDIILLTSSSLTEPHTDDLILAKELTAEGLRVSHASKGTSACAKKMHPFNDHEINAKVSSKEKILSVWNPLNEV